ncbi:hypothetical protein SAMN04488513_101748 [Pseudozobellia thermophila]|uniref:Uncharacterized protein n=1 Tax=Pseudozobellia thermophila TaxID=192903 RepID=A0A1M6CGE5_9FLAO|nr:hypothetical protein SAMN04488513_101748 [Pseudozobellia thermophila]
MIVFFYRLVRRPTGWFPQKVHYKVSGSLYFTDFFLLMLIFEMAFLRGDMFIFVESML